MATANGNSNSCWDILCNRERRYRLAKPGQKKEEDSPLRLLGRCFAGRSRWHLGLFRERIKGGGGGAKEARWLRVSSVKGPSRAYDMGGFTLDKLSWPVVLHHGNGGLRGMEEERRGEEG